MVQKKSDRSRKASDNMCHKGNRSLAMCWNAIFGELTDRKFKFLLIYLSVLSLLELVAYKAQGIFSLLASRLWLAGGVAIFLTIWAYFIKAIKADFKNKNILSVALIFVLIAFLYALIGNVEVTEINPDATQQAAAGMASFRADDFNYTGKAFLGYPNRQYILAALPALLLGRSIFSLQLGFALPFILGIMILYCGLREWAQRKNVSTVLAVLPLYALFVFPFVTEYYINFEQAIYPVSFTMIAAGFFLLLLCKQSLAALLGLAWIFCLFSNSYTPVLATLGLFVVLIAFFVVTLLTQPERMPFHVSAPRLFAKSLLVVEANSILFFIATLIGQRQDRITEVHPEIDFLSVTFQSIYEFLTDRNARFFGMLGIPVILYLLAGLTYRLKLRDVLLSLWVMGVFVASNLMTGYTAYQPAWIMQRALIVVPVLILGMTLTTFDIIDKYKPKIRKGAVVIIAVAFGFIGIYNFRQINQSFIYFNYIQPMKYMLEDLESSVKEEGLESNSEFNLVLYTDNALIKNPADYCEFFFPNARAYTPDYGTFPQELDPGLTTFIYGDSEINVEVPVDATDVVTFENKRHHMTVNWYKASITN